MIEKALYKSPVLLLLLFFGCLCPDIASMWKYPLGNVGLIYHAMYIYIYATQEDCFVRTVINYL